MADAIRIIITRNANSDGTGGTVIDDATAVLGEVGGVAVLDHLTQAFADAYGIHSPQDADGNPQPVSAVRNFSYRLRAYAAGVVTAYIQKAAAEQAKEQASQQAAASMNAVVIVDTVV